jgi:hypothetical protein
MTDAPSTDLAAHTRPTVVGWLIGLEAVLAVAAFGGAIGLVTGAIPLTGDLEGVPYSPLRSRGFRSRFSTVGFLRWRRWRSSGERHGPASRAALDEEG